MKNHLSRRERERKELRLRILDAASQLFQAGGEAAVTLRQVAEMIEFSATAIYSHFPSKEALVQEICEKEFLRSVRALQQAEHIPDAMERLRKIAYLYADFGLQHPEHYRVLLMREAGTQTSVDTPVPTETAMPPRSSSGSKISPPDSAGKADVSARPYDFLQKAVFKAMAAGCFKPEYRDVALLAQILWSCLHGIVALHLVRAQHSVTPWKPVQSILEATVEGLFNGLTAPASQVPPSWHR